MKFWKSVIRIWFTLASIASFLIGWAVLARAAAIGPAAARCRSADRLAACRRVHLATADQDRMGVGSMPRRCSTIGLVAGGRFELPTNGL